MKHGIKTFVNFIKSRTCNNNIKSVHLYVDLIGRDKNCIDIAPSGDFIPDNTIDLFCDPSTINIHLAIMNPIGSNQLFSDEQIDSIIEFREELVKTFPNIQINHPIGKDDVI